MKKYIIPLLVLIVAITVSFFDFGMVGQGISFAAVLPLLSIEFEGEDNLPGIARAYIVPVSEIDTEAVPTATPSTALEKITIIGSHVLATGKYFVKLYSTLGKGNLKFEAKGSRDFENFEISGTLFYPSTKSEALAFSSAILGQDLIIMLEENSDSDHFLQVGTVKLPARIVSMGDWGTELNGEKGITLTIGAFHGKSTPYLYTGTIALSDVEIIS